MAFEMVDGNDGFVQGKRQGVGIARTRQKCTAQARPLGVGDGIDVVIGNARFLQTALRQRHDAADVVAAGKFGNNAAVFGMHRHLGVKLVRQQAAFGVVKRNARFVAG